MDPKSSPLEIESIEQKIECAQELLKPSKDNLRTDWTTFKNTFEPKRDVPIVFASKMPPKKGLSFLEGKQRLIHDLASIELQAMELGFRTLIEFSQQTREKIPTKFFSELEQITLEESQHLKLCLETLKHYQGHWGMFPVHLGLWRVASNEDSFIERILKVHRYLEASGLDASFKLLKRIKSVTEENSPIAKLIERIATDEIKHVQFGSHWFKRLCEEKERSRVGEIKRILKKYHHLLPQRKEKISMSLRKEAGFTEEEVRTFCEIQKTQIVE